MANHLSVTIKPDPDKIKALFGIDSVAQPVVITDCSNNEAVKPRHMFYSTERLIVKHTYTKTPPQARLWRWWKPPALSAAEKKTFAADHRAIRWRIAAGAVVGFAVVAVALYIRPPEKPAPRRPVDFSTCYPSANGIGVTCPPSSAFSAQYRPR